MTTKLDEAIALLRAEKQRIDDALAALGASDGVRTSKPTRAAKKAIAAKPQRKKRTLSAAARKRISEATKARWAKVRAEKAKK